jgi:Tfp pilus assembly protein PilN
MRAVNLLPKDGAKGGSLGSHNLPALVGGGMGFLVVAALAGGYLSESSKVSSAQSALTAAQQQLASTPKPPAASAPKPAPPQATAAAAQEQPRLQAVSAILSQRIAYDRILREFSAVLPSDVWILSVAMTQPVNGATDGFTISGTTYSYDSVARMLARMNLIPDLTGVQLTSVSGGGKLVQFGIGASIKGAAAPPAPAATAPAPAPVVASTDTTSTDTTSGGSASAAGSGQ